MGFLKATTVLLISCAVLCCRYQAIFSQQPQAPAPPSLAGPTQVSAAHPAANIAPEAGIAAILAAEFRVGKDGRPLIVTGQVQGQPARFLVDTGCSASGLDFRLKAALGTATGSATFRTSAGNVELDAFRWPDARIGNLRIRSDHPIFCHDLSELRAAAGEEFDGILGMDVLKDYVVQIDFDAGLLRFLRETPANIAELGEALPLVAHSNPPRLLADCGILEREFIFDTGSTNICIDHEAFAQLDKAGLLNTGASRAISSAGGQFSVKTGLLQTFTIGHFVHKDMVCDNDSLNILGIRHLSRFFVTLDFPNGVAYLRPGKTYSRPAYRGATGIRPVRTPAGFTVKGVTPNSAAAIAGIQPGDQVSEINGARTAGMDMFELRKLLTSNPGGKLELRLLRDNTEIRASLIVRDRFAR